MFGRRQQEELTTRIVILTRLVQVALVLVGTSYFSVQVARGAHFRELAENNRLRKVAIEAPRGVIRDRHGLPLVENVPDYTLRIDRSRSKDLDASLRFAASVLGDSREELEQALAKGKGLPDGRPIRLAGGLQLSEMTQFAAAQLEYPEFEVDVDKIRLYRYAHHTAHLLGYLGEVSRSDLERPDSPYRPGDRLGKKGIEKQYDLPLRGTNGATVLVVDSHGQEKQELDKVPAIPGGDLKLTLDLGLQQHAALLLDGAVGAVVALDPSTGDVLALQSSPSFNPNSFTHRLSREEWQELIENPYHPLQNRALQNAYPPGSIFKIVTALAALDRGLVDSNFAVFCPGYSIVYGNRFRCHKKGGHGTVNLHSAIKLSCNVYFHALGQKLQIDTLAGYARRFGLGRISGIDLDGEVSGLVPDTRWSKERRKQPWYPGETISVVTGQGPILTTPMQLAVLMAAVANNGYLVKPRLFRNVPAERTSLGIASEHINAVRRGLWAVVNDGGTASAARVQGVEIAGKTGTAQVVRQATWTSNDELAEEERDHAWFASFAPFDDPKLVIVVFVEHGGGGSKTAAPIAKALYEKYFRSAQTPRAAAAS
jgi:penicillin-binding protein 2